MRAALLLLSLLFAGCAIQRSLQAQDAKKQLVGMSDEEILACMGPPHVRSSLGNTVVWQYKSGNGYSANSGIASANLYGNSALVTGSAITTRRFCTVNIVMANRAVQSVNYIGPTGGILTEGEQCAFAIRACLPQ
jgi:hypothetical protein